jgi:hypothetical protein
MAGVFKKLTANDIKITPFEAHKQYNTVDLASIGAQTASLAWSGLNKSTFSTGSRQYYQIDKLYYRNYIQERAHRLELDDATYTTQERRLYESASLLSLSQKTFGSEVQPGSFEISGSKNGVQFHFKDDGFGNLFDVNKGKDNFPNEDNRVFYLAPVQAYKRGADDNYASNNLLIDIETGNPIVNIDYGQGDTYTIPVYNETVYDDSYFQNIVTYKNVTFSPHILGLKHYNISHPALAGQDADHSRVIIDHKPYLNFNNEDFTLSFYFEFLNNAGFEELWTKQPASRLGDFLLTKEGAQNSPPLGTQAGGLFSTSTSGALDITSTPSKPSFPYRVKLFAPADNTGSIEFSRSDGNVISKVTAPVFLTNEDKGTNAHIVLVKNGNRLQIFKNGTQIASADDLTIEPCQNKADLVLYSKRNPDGTYYDAGDSWERAFKGSQFMIYNKALSNTEIINVSQSITGTPNVGNLFYDNGFAVITHPKYMDVFDGGKLHTLKYKNTHLINENEYQCTMTEDEFEFTTNPTARKIPSIENEDVASFTTSSAFKPYITTIGLYDDDGNLLVVGKLAQPIKASSETDTTFVIRFDT